MATKAQLPLIGRAYVAVVIAAGLLATAASVYSICTQPPPWTSLIFAAFTLISGTLIIRVPTISATISVSEMFVFTAVLFYGAPAATLIVALDGVFLSISSKARRPSRLLFNIAEPALSIWLASQIFFQISGIDPISKAAVKDVVPLLIPIGLLATTYFLFNSWLNAIAIGFAKRTSPLALWREHFLWLSLNYFGGASVAVLFVRGETLDSVSFIVIVPLLLISYLTQKYSGAVLEDARKLNSLYLSTITTLANAIDAKDQITHGHIKRVQVYAVGLAKKLGIADRKILNAIDAAALLHDTGKLAVPEYILNKPGKLTAAEFEKMKLHASVGADILSTIEFPYPVVPIVRHHHESWDGTGYPAGLKGTEIPIGARILAVVDCFDALTSDRPYRPKLPDAEAIRILQDRRGTMYDPLVVDTFLKVYSEIGPNDIDGLHLSDSLKKIADSHVSPADYSIPDRRAEIPGNSEEMLALYDLARSLSGRTSLADAGDVIGKHLARLLPANVCVFFSYESASDELVVAHVAPDVLPLRGYRIRNGERISGWVAAHRQTILNSDPALDFGSLAASENVGLRSCLTTPLVLGETLVGVLSICSTAPAAFTEDHRRSIEAVVQQISRVVRDALAFEVSHAKYRDALTGLPNGERLRQLSSPEWGLCDQKGLQPLSVLVVRVESARVAVSDDDEYNRVLSNVASTMRRVLRSADILFRYADDQFVVLLSQTDQETAHAISARIKTAVLSAASSTGSRLHSPVDVTVVSSICPPDGASIAELISAASISTRVAGDPESSSGHCCVH